MHHRDVQHTIKIWQSRRVACSTPSVRRAGTVLNGRRFMQIITNSSFNPIRPKLVLFIATCMYCIPLCSVTSLNALCSYWGNILITFWTTLSISTSGVKSCHLKNLIQNFWTKNWCKRFCANLHLLCTSRQWWAEVLKKKRSEIRFTNQRKINIHTFWLLKQN